MRGLSILVVIQTCQDSMRTGAGAIEKKRTNYNPPFGLADCFLNSHGTQMNPVTNTENHIITSREFDAQTQLVRDYCGKVGSFSRRFYRDWIFLYGVYDYFSAKTSAFEKLIFYFQRQPEDSRQA